MAKSISKEAVKKRSEKMTKGKSIPFQVIRKKCKGKKCKDKGKAMYKPGKIVRPSLLKKAINANTPKGEPDADAIIKKLRDQKTKSKASIKKVMTKLKTTAATKKAKKKALEVNKAKFASMEESGTIWPKSAKTGERTKPRKTSKKKK